MAQQECAKAHQLLMGHRQTAARPDTNHRQLTCLITAGRSPAPTNPSLFHVYQHKEEIIVSQTQVDQSHAKRVTRSRATLFQIVTLPQQLLRFAGKTVQDQGRQIRKHVQPLKEHAV
jgi:hypothetical protein